MHFFVFVTLGFHDRLLQTSLLVSFSAALDKNSLKLTNNNNVFHELSEQSLPPQVVYKPMSSVLNFLNFLSLIYKVDSKRKYAIQCLQS